MNILISCTTIHYFISSCLSVPTNINSLHESTNSSKNQENIVVQKIKELEQQKDELFIEINKAMEESVALMKNNNVPNAEQGVSYIEDLKKQIKNIANINNSQEHYHGTYSDEGNFTTPYDEKNSVVADARRKSDKYYKRNKNIVAENMYIGKTDAFRRNEEAPETSVVTELYWSPVTSKHSAYEKFYEEAEKDLDRLLNGGVTGQRLKDRLKRREKMKKQLEEWVNKKIEEKKKIKLYKDALIGAEKCPRRGWASKTKLNHKAKSKARYPCCRKCCKKSYLGCL